MLITKENVGTYREVSKSVRDDKIIKVIQWLMENDKLISNKELTLFRSFPGGRVRLWRDGELLGLVVAAFPNHGP